MGRFKFFDKNECFIEYKWALMGDFLETLFPEEYERKYSLVGDGIYNLIHIDNKIYNIDVKECKKLLPNDNKKAFRDTIKDVIVEKICNKLKEHNVEYTTNSGKFITLKHDGYMFKIEVIKKMEMPK